MIDSTEIAQKCLDQFGYFICWDTADFWREGLVIDEITNERCDTSPLLGPMIVLSETNFEEYETQMVFLGLSDDPGGYGKRWLAANKARYWRCKEE